MGLPSKESLCNGFIVFTVTEVAGGAGYFTLVAIGWVDIATWANVSSYLLAAGGLLATAIIGSDMGVSPPDMH